MRSAVTAARVPDAAASAARVLWIDIAKGIAILFVVFVHTGRGMRDAGVPLPPSFFEPTETTLEAFVMPLFFFLSGLFVEVSSRRPAPEVFEQKLRTLGYPYVLWTLLYAAVSAPAGQRDGGVLDVLATLAYRPHFHLWFLYVLAMATSAYVALRRAQVPSCGILALAVAWHESAALVPLQGWPPLDSLRWYFPYLAAGAVANAPLRIRLGGARRDVLAAGACAAAGAVVALMASPLSRTCAFFLLVAACGTAATIAFAAALADTRAGRVFAHLGARSLEIYLAHLLGTTGTTLLLAQVLGVRSTALIITVAIGVGVALPLGLVAIARRFGTDAVFRWPRRRTSALASVVAP